ncbi:HEAT repeat domain-containing protein [Nocardia otitidiscaviarum]|uniref:HEAT repeat domain-containing protein n=1 Tax=Nocardia otitidiscaviarum TaxID=1823 RepID=UPI001895B779|nr:HEAT repeat domain-containing protein [Nocardia otitidiscaviarum]MBF6235908.1 HEAT repeat domain-containing protein [Nocardia otitidiscaviarum]
MLIGEVARRLGVSARMLRHYDSLGLVRPTGRTLGGYREYAAADIRRLFLVEGLRSLGLSLREIGRALDDPEFSPATLVGDLIRKTEDRLARERELLDRLRTVDAANPDDWQDVLRIVELLHALRSPDAARRQQAVLAPAEDAAMPADLLADAILTESDPNVAGALRWALARAGGDGVSQLARGLRSEDAAIRLRAVLALAELPGDEASAALTEALTDPDPDIRRHAALAAGARGITQSIPILVHTVATGPNDIDAAEILGALAHDPAWSTPILTALTNEFTAHPTNPAARIRLTQSLAELPTPLATPTLHHLTRDPDRTVSGIATALLHRPTAQTP